MIHPLVLAINKEEQQTGTEEADWDSLRCTSRNLDNQGTNQAGKTHQLSNPQEVRTVYILGQLCIGEVRSALLDVMVCMCMHFISDFCVDSSEI